MVVKTHYNKINEPIKVSLVFFEINFLELAMVTLSLLIIMLLCGFINVYINLFGIYFFLSVLSAYVPLVFLLSFSNKQDHPQFLVSWIAYRVFQPKRITFFNPNICINGR